MMTDFDYSGDELDLFSLAENWKKYWSNEIKPFLGNKILEVGAGIGSTARVLNYKTYEHWLALEPDGNLCAVIEKKLKEGTMPVCLDIRKGTSATLKHDEFFDTVLYIDVLEHIQDDQAELVRIKQHLIRGGHVIIVAPAHNVLYTEFDRKIGHFRRYNKKILLSVIPEGYSVNCLKYLDSVGLLASLANKLLLQSDTPTKSQIQLWDKLMVRSSKIVDKLL